MKRVTKKTVLHRGDEVLWCRKLISRQRFYDKHTASVQPDTPIHLYRGVVLHVTERNGVLLHVTSKNVRGLTGRKHWCPWQRIWARTGRTLPAPSANHSEWSDEVQHYYRKRSAELRDAVA